jgi:hypothetical protein
MAASNGNINSSLGLPQGTQLPTPTSPLSPNLSNKEVEEENMPELVKPSRSKGADVLMKDYSERNGMYFSNCVEASDAMNHILWYPRMKDNTIPKTDEEDRLVVRRLVGAFLDMDVAKDTEGNAYRKRLTPGTNVFYEPWTIESCAWEILVGSQHYTLYGRLAIDIM